MIITMNYIIRMDISETKDLAKEKPGQSNKTIERRAAMAQ